MEELYIFWFTFFCLTLNNFSFVLKVMEAGRKGFQSHGVELNSVLVFYSKFSAWRQNIKNATFSRQDLFKVDYSKYNNVVIFGVEEMVYFFFNL